MTSKENNKRAIIKDDEIDLIALVKTIWDGRKIIYYSIGVCVLVGLLIIFLSPAKYTASATLLPSSQKKSNMGGLGALAGMAGINLGSMMGESEGIPAEIYPQVVNSYPFLKEFIHEKFHFEKYDEPISIYDYVVADTIPSLGMQITKYTIRLPRTLKEIIQGKKEQESNVVYGVLNLTKEEKKAIKMVSDLFEINVEKKTDLVHIKVEVDEPVLAAQYVEEAVDLLQKYVIKYKTKQVRGNLDFVQKRYNEKKIEYEHTQLEYYNYKDGHRNIISERIDAEYQRLSDAYDIASSVYKDLSKQLEGAKIAVKEQTPVFTVLEPAKIPHEKSAPRKGIILVVSVSLGTFMGLLIVILSGIWFNIKPLFN